MSSDQVDFLTGDSLTTSDLSRNTPENTPEKIILCFVEQISKILKHVNKVSSPAQTSTGHANNINVVLPAPTMPAPIMPAPIMPAPIIPAPIMPAPQLLAFEHSKVLDVVNFIKTSNWHEGWVVGKIDILNSTTMVSIDFTTTSNITTKGKNQSLKVSKSSVIYNIQDPIDVEKLCHFFNQYYYINLTNLLTTDSQELIKANQSMINLLQSQKPRGEEGYDC